MTVESQLSPVERLLHNHDKLCAAAKKIMVAKNHDYTAGSKDPYANFRASESLGVPAAVGILLRMTDKLQRVKTFAERGELKVVNEGLEDAVIDLINYSILAYGVLTEGEEDGTEVSSRPSTHPNCS